MGTVGTMQRSYVLRLLTVLATLLTAYGCTTEVEGGTSRETFPDEFADAYCRAVSGCCEEADVPYDGDVCHDHVKDIAQTHLEKNDVPRATYHADIAHDCVSAYSSITAKCGRPSAEELAAGIAICSRMFEGSVEDGATCTNSAECAGPDSSCLMTYDDSGAEKGYACAFFVERPHGELGSPCVASCASPGKSLDCLVGPAWPGLLTTACYATEGLWCNERVGACVALSMEGAECESSSNCAEGLYCSSRTCAAQKLAGEPCDSILADECKEGAVCSYGVCTLPKDLGQPCYLGVDCESGFCSYDTQTCAVNVAYSAYCSSWSFVEL